MASMVVLFAVFGGVGYAKSSCSQAARTVYHVVAHKNPPRSLASNNNGNNSNGSNGNSNHHEATLHAYPSPGFFCASKGSKHKIKLILSNERYDRLLDRGWTIGAGPYLSAGQAFRACPRPYWQDDDNDD